MGIIVIFLLMGSTVAFVIGYSRMIYKMVATEARERQ